MSHPLLSAAAVVVVSDDDPAGTSFIPSLPHPSVFVSTAVFAAVDGVANDDHAAGTHLYHLCLPLQSQPSLLLLMVLPMMVMQLVPHL